MRYFKIKIAEIDHQNDQFKLSYLSSRERLTESIRRIGLIHPVILRTSIASEGYQIVSGFQRIQSCLDLGIKDIYAAVYERDELPDINALLLNLHQTITSRHLNILEKSLALKKLQNTGDMEKETIIRDILPLLSLEPNENIFDRVLSLWELTEGIKKYIVENDVNLSNAVRFLNFSSEDQTKIIKLLSTLKLGLNKLKELLTYIEEIGHRDDISPHEMVSDEMEAILSNDDVPTPQKANQIRGLLKRKRFPKLVAMEKEVQENIKQLKLPPEILLSTPPFLEGDKLKVEFSFKNREELKKIINKLSDISDHEELETILKML